MPAKTLTKEGLERFVKDLVGTKLVIGVRRKENKFAFGQLSDASELVLDYDVTLESPKKFFQPPHEKILDFTTNKATKLTAVMKQEPFVLIGVHTYDLKALNQMDRIWATDNADEHYLSRRRRATIIAIEPTRTSKWSFWASMEAQFVDGGFDLLLTDIGDRYVLEIGTEKGSELLARHAPDAVDANPNDLRARDESRKRLATLCNEDRRIRVKHNEIPQLIRKNTDHPIWQRQAEKCYSCGSCNLVCPTCYCFDIKDLSELDLVHGSRTRTWDGCLLEDFALVASGENFREERANRFRHRILRKTLFVAERIGELACVGCGRCSEACLPDITDPVKVINAIAEGT